ncbi:SDR family NAD(P)-dependent oxidoreductase [Arthrobacter sp. NPDC092385]|uniref:SDR family NAD(P)-dependent oxidoreductase n=1 Tax=Arthrobacter sp. NPDC092385 TaxID=3363943 RepID=UPI0037F3B62D
MQLDGKIALVTGAGTGIGRGTAHRLAEEGAFVYVTGRNLEPLQAVAADIGERARAVRADVTDKDDLEQLANLIRDEHGGLDIVFANAGGGHPIPLAEITTEDLDRQFGVNVKGVLFTVQAMLPLLRDGSSIIINTSITADMGLADFSLYAATKAAVRSFTKSWTTDLKHRRIRVNGVSPGVVPTEAYTTELGMTDAQVQEYIDRVTPEVPAGRVGSAEDIGDAVVFLASDASNYITGVDLVVDGGMTAVYAGKA